ncbi:MAG: CBS domain-containing protein [Actinobacteria bacterium]|nr:CBS domain-containing protein [Actinomycetota bacterium]
MSPRAAWQLEALGFKEVYDFVGGKLAWIERGLPTQGAGPHYAVAGEVARRDVPTCPLGTTAEDVDRTLDGSAEAFCLVVNEARVVLGRVRRRDLPDGRSLRVEEFMRWGPATVRPREELKPLVERMHAAAVATVLVTERDGRLVGVVHRDEADAFLRERRPDPP